jgi:predicted NBD/HSP70 family sugar kinase
MSRTTHPAASGTPQRGTGSAGRAATHRRLIRPEDGRRHNRGLVLENIYDTPGLSRADLARRTGLTRVTISDLVAELLGEGFVTEAGLVDQARPGKPGTRLNLVSDARDILAVDLSSQDLVRGAVLSLTGEIVHRADYPLDGATGDAALQAVTALAHTLVGASTRPVLGIGVGSPGLVAADGAVAAAHNLDWHHLPLQALLADALDRPVIVANDANLAAIAEHRFGTAPADLIRIQISRGVGAGVLLGGTPMVGASRAAGEIGHLVVDSHGVPCQCGKSGCLETWASVPALTRRIAADPARSEEIRTEAGRRLGLALAPVVALLDLTEVIVGGPAELIEGPFLTASQTLIHDRTHMEDRSPVTLRSSALGADAVLYGAAALVLRRHLGVH